MAQRWDSPPALCIKPQRWASPPGSDDENGFCPPADMNHDEFGQIFTPCSEECQYQARVDDAFNGTHFYDSPLAFSKWHFFVPGATVSAIDIDTVRVSATSVTVVGYNFASWDYPAGMVTYNELRDEALEFADTFQRMRTGMSREAQRIYKLANMVSFDSENTLDACDAVDVGTTLATANALPGSAALITEDGAPVARKLIDWALVGTGVAGSLGFCH